MKLHEVEAISSFLHRLRVPGGWIYSIAHGRDKPTQCVFVPEPQTKPETAPKAALYPDHGDFED